MLFIFFFFFSSRRRHTRFDCDWSSDVCSSDLYLRARPRGTGEVVLEGRIDGQLNRAKALFEDRDDLERPGALAIGRARTLELNAESHAHREPPALGRPHPGSQPPPREFEPHVGTVGAQK